MAKEGLNLNKISQLVEPETNWALCIGAGCSLPIFPNWKELSISLAKRYSLDMKMSEKYRDYLSPDLLIQSTFERANRPDEFANVLAEILYENLFDGLATKEKQLVTKCLTSKFPLKGLDWKQYVKIITDKGSSSSLSMGEYIADSILQSNRPPMSILSFNAEVLLPSLINAFANIKYKRYGTIIDYMCEPISVNYQKRVPYYFCHGLVSVPYSSTKAKKAFNAEDKLVFSENEYLQLANSAYSWQVSSFMNTLMNSKVFFVGLSFTDPNLRRWLSWLHKSRVDAIARVDKTAQESTSHYWIEKKPVDASEVSWIEASVAHLGIRMIWIDDYSQIVEVLKKAIK